MIKTKGPTNTHVIARNNVPIHGVCDAVAEHKSLEWIMNRFLITEDELFECLDTYVDLAEKTQYVINLSCVADPVNSDIYGIETAEINDKMYFSILIYGRLFFDIKKLHELFTYTLNLIIVETMLDLKEKIEVDPDCMHGTVLEAFRSSYGEIDETNIDHILTQLDHQSLMRMMKNDNN
jgi:hypothetical protein